MWKHRINRSDRPSNFSSDASLCENFELTSYQEKEKKDCTNHKEQSSRDTNKFEGCIRRRKYSVEY